MKSFLKTVAAVMVGLFATVVFSVLFLTCSVIGSLATAPKSTTTSQPGDVLFLKINGEISEIPSDSPFAALLNEGNMPLSLRGYLNAIAIAKQDPNIVGIYLNTDGMAGGPATFEAIHDALVDFRTSGKWVVSYNDNYSLGQYYVASTANEVYVNTIGTVTLDGMTSVLTYPKALLDKLGVEMQIFRVGTFKSAVEPYMIEHISDANRLQTETYLRSIWGQMAIDIASSRNLSVDRINELANQAVSYMKSDELSKTGLVDGQLYKVDVEKIILDKTGKKELQGILPEDIVDSEYERYFPVDKSKKIAVIYASGEIGDDSSAEGFSTATDGIYPTPTIKDIKAAADDDEVKAVVLRVNSPGGSAFASEQIWKALADLKEKKPLVVSMGDYAASGGYYISCMGNFIIAEPNTLTGSIGVFGMLPNLKGLVTDKLGVNFEEVKTHQFGTITGYRAVTPAERAKIQGSVENTYDLFTRRCADGRGLSQDSIKVIGGGRVWTGSDALKIGLVDALGGIEVAVAKAAELANLSEGDYSRVNYPAPKDPFESFMEMMGEQKKGIELRILDHVLGISKTERATLRFIENIQYENKIQTRSFDSVIL